MKNLRKNILFISFLLICGLYSSCIKDLDTTPIDPKEVVVFEPQAALAKIYGGLALTGNRGPAGQPDIVDIDEGFSSFLRLLWNLNELTTDEAICAWDGDKEVFPLNFQYVNSENGIITGMYYRIYFEITMCNHFIKEVKDNSDLKIEVAEVRLMRALMYYYIIDLYGGGPFVDENSAIGVYFPNYIKRADLFKYVESEVLDLLPVLKDPKTNLYGRFDKAAAWMLLARLYLNSQVYTGEERYDDAAKYSKLVIDSKKYTLESEYKNLYVADNHISPEFIFTINFDGANTKTYGGTTFLTNSCITGDMGSVEADYGVGGWGGNRAREALVKKFSNTGNDERAMFYKTNRTLEIEKPSDFKQGYSIVKFRNVTRGGKKGQDYTYVDIDFPLFRLGETYLNYAEAICKSKSSAYGTKADAVFYVNELRKRAKANFITESDLNNVNSFFADERARELYFEGQRRTDLIRFNLYNNTIWDWKGGIKEGKPTSSHLQLFPLPALDLASNPNLRKHQNPGY